MNNTINRDGVGSDMTDEKVRLQHYEDMVAILDGILDLTVMDKVRLHHYISLLDMAGMIKYGDEEE